MSRRYGRFVDMRIIQRRMDEKDLRRQREFRQRFTVMPVVNVAIEPADPDDRGPVVDVVIMPADRKPEVSS